MRLKPCETKASNNSNARGSSTVHPKTLPPKTKGATSKPEFPKRRLSISTSFFVSAQHLSEVMQPGHAFRIFQRRPTPSLAHNAETAASTRGRRRFVRQ